MCKHKNLDFFVLICELFCFTHEIGKLRQLSIWVTNKCYMMENFISIRQMGKTSYCAKKNAYKPIFRKCKKDRNIYLFALEVTYHLKMIKSCIFTVTRSIQWFQLLIKKRRFYQLLLCSKCLVIATADAKLILRPLSFSISSMSLVFVQQKTTLLHVFPIDLKKFKAA